MTSVFLFSKIEQACIEEVKNILGDAGEKFRFNRFDSDRSGGSANVRSGSFDLKINKPSVNISILAGKIVKIAMPKTYQMSVDIYFSVVTTDASNEQNRRDDVYPVLTAILIHFCGLKLPVENGEIVLEPKSEFQQKFNESPYLEYVCCFTTQITLDMDEDNEADILGVLAEYYLKPKEIGGQEPVYSEVINAEK